MWSWPHRFKLFGENTAPVNDHVFGRMKYSNEMIISLWFAYECVYQILVTTSPWHPCSLTWHQCNYNQGTEHLLLSPKIIIAF